MNIAIINKKELSSFKIFFKPVVSINNIFFFFYITSRNNASKAQFYFTFGVNLFYCRYYPPSPTHGVHVIWLGHCSKMDNKDIWFLTGSWLNIVYDVCWSTWMCFYLQLVILRNSRTSYMFQHGISNYANISPWLFVSIFLFLEIPYFCVWWCYSFQCFYILNLNICLFFHDGQIL